MDQQAAIWRYQAAAREARADRDLSAQAELLAQDRAREDTMERLAAARPAGGVAAQQAAMAKLQPIMRRCAISNTRRLEGASTEETDAIVEAALRACHPAIVAVARTVELVHMSSDGLDTEIAARLRAELKHLVAIDRGQTGNFQ